MTTCCYCAETNNSLVLLEEAATVECKTCKLKMHTKCYIVAHTSRTLVCNPADAEAVRCATHDTALTAHDQVQQGKGVDCVPPILAQSLKLRLQPLAKEYEDDKELLAFVPFPAAEDYEPGHDQGLFGDARLDLAETANADGELLLDRWRKFAAEGDGVFDLDCEIRQDTAKVAKRKDKLTKEKPAPKKAPTKKQSVPVATTTPVEFDRRRFAVIDGNNRIAAITNILKLP